uniref:18S pre-ribosomal assembly protein gar2 n=1 Tax=Rhizophora mucronata TaxID=61149 RepID=A0A2P2KGS6_RHIMU
MISVDFSGTESTTSDIFTTWSQLSNSSTAQIIAAFDKTASLQSRSDSSVGELIAQVAKVVSSAWLWSSDLETE